MARYRTTPLGPFGFATVVKISIDVSQPKLINLFVLIIVALQLLTPWLAAVNDFGKVKSKGKGDFVI